MSPSITSECVCVRVCLFVSSSLLLPCMCKQHPVSHAEERWECLATAAGQGEETVKLQRGEEAEEYWWPAGCEGESKVILDHSH